MEEVKRPDFRAFKTSPIALSCAPVSLKGSNFINSPRNASRFESLMPDDFFISSFWEMRPAEPLCELRQMVFFYNIFWQKFRNCDLPPALTRRGKNNF